MFRLTWNDEGQWQTLTVKHDQQVTVGRGETVDVFLPDAGVSREHADLFWKEEQLTIRNISRKDNPMTVGKQKLQQGDEIALWDGVTIALGNATITVERHAQHNVPKMKCNHCDNQVDYNPKAYCPFCGHALASAETVLGRF